MAQSKRTFFGIAGAVVISVLLLSSCGGGKKKGSGPAAEPPVKNGVAANQPEPAPKKDEPKPEPREREKVADPVTGSMSYLDRLMGEGAYKEAQRVADELLIEIGDSPRKTEVEEYLKNIKDLLAYEQEIAPKLAGLQKNDAQLEAQLKADERSLLVLHKVVRENPSPELSIACLRYLRKVDDATCVNAVYQSLKTNQLGSAEEEYAKTLKYFVQKHSSGKISEDLLLNMMLALPCATRDGLKQALDGAIRSWHFQQIPKPRLDSYANQIRADTTGRARHLVRLLVLVYELAAQKDAKKFDSMFSEPVLKDLRAFVRKASNSGSAPIREWGRELSPRLGMINFKTLEVNLLCHFSLNDPMTKNYLRDTLTPKTIVIRTIDNQKERRIPGVDGKGFLCGGKKRSDGFLYLPDRKQFLRNMSNDYSYSLWIKPLSYPNKEAHYPFCILLGKEDKTVGLLLQSNGRISMIHPTEDQVCEAKSKRPVPLKRWTHVVGTVSRKTGKVHVYINGRLSGTASFPAGAAVQRIYSNNPTYGVVGAKAPRKPRPKPIIPGGDVNDDNVPGADRLERPRKKKQWKKRRAGNWNNDNHDDGLATVAPPEPVIPQKEFNGVVDEIRLYSSAIDAEMVKALYELHKK